MSTVNGHITVNGQPVPLHASHGQVVALFPSGVLGLRDPMGMSVLPNSDGSIDFSVMGDYYLPGGYPRHGGTQGDQSPVYDVHGIPRHEWDKRSGRMSQSQYHTAQSPHRPSVRQSVSPGNTERSPVLLTPVYPGTGPAERRPVARSHWNSDTHVEMATAFYRAPCTTSSGMWACAWSNYFAKLFAPAVFV